MAKKLANKRDDNMVKRHQDLLEIARLVSCCMNRDYLIKTCLDHINKRLRIRACCILLDEGEMKAYCRVDEHDSRTNHLSLCKEGIVWNVLKKDILSDLRSTLTFKITN